MSEETKWTCNCGCGVSVFGHKREGWLLLKQQQPEEKKNFLPKDDLKLDGVLHFSSVDCLIVWAKNADEDGVKLLNTIELFTGVPRGDLKAKNTEGLYI